jgi:hypothetical protein
MTRSEMFLLYLRKRHRHSELRKRESPFWKYLAHARDVIEVVLGLYALYRLLAGAISFISNLF